MVYKFIATITDCETGEILGQNKDVKYITLDLVNRFCHVWLNSTLRGIEKGRDLSLSLTIRKPEVQNVIDNSLF